MGSFFPTTVAKPLDVTTLGAKSRMTYTLYHWIRLCGLSQFPQDIVGLLIDCCDCYDYMFKLVLVGNRGVGQTAFLSKFTNNTRSSGADFDVTTIEIDNKRIQLQIWDNLHPPYWRYYHDAHGVIMMYDVTNKDSFYDLNQWFHEICRSGEHLHLMIIGNKCDLSSNYDINDIVSSRQAQDYTMTLLWYYVIYCLQTSAKTGENINKAMKLFTKQIYYTIKLENKRKEKQKNIQ